MTRLETHADERRRRLLHERLRASNTRSSPVLRELRGTPADSEVPVEVYAFEGEELAGGLVGHMRLYWLHVDLLWVSEESRGTGLGSRLLAAAERQAREEHQATGSRVATFGFQAPGFYAKQGYALVGTVPDYPPGCSEHLFVKRL